MNRIAALEKLSKHFSDDDLMNIAFELNAENAVNEKSSHSEIVRDLLQYCETHGALGKLAERCAARILSVDWRGIFIDSEPAPRVISQPIDTLSATPSSESRSTTSPIMLYLGAGAGLIALIAVAVFVVSQLTGRPAAPTSGATATQAATVTAPGVTDTPRPTPAPTVAPSDTPRPTPAPTVAPSDTPRPTPAPTDTPQPTTKPSDTTKPTVRPVVVTRVVRATLVVVVQATQGKIALTTALPQPTPVVCTNQTFFALSPVQASALGCPLTNSLLASEAARQTFQNGIMVWLKDKNRIFVFANTGQSWDLADTWKDGQSLYACQPNGVGVPIRGFGKVWCTNDRIQAVLGTATSDEPPDVADYQEFQRGTVLKLRGVQRVYIHTSP